MNVVYQTGSEAAGGSDLPKLMDVWVNILIGTDTSDGINTIIPFSHCSKNLFKLWNSLCLVALVNTQ